MKKQSYIMHGLTNHKLYRTWNNMRQRCNNKSLSAYQYYGAKGVKVCERWNDFANFVADMGERPTEHHTVDRIDGNGDYSPENCRWATKSEQATNTKIRNDNVSGYKGVSWESRLNKWRAYVTVNKKRVYLGVFSDKEDAVKARELYYVGI